MSTLRWAAVLASLFFGALIGCGDDAGSGGGGGVATSAGGGSSTSITAGGGNPGGGGATSAGGSGGTGGGGASTGGGASGGAGGGSVWDLLSDEFDDPDSLADWKLREVEEGGPAQYSALDIDTTSPGELFIVPVDTLWVNDQVGPFVYKEVTGDFVVESAAAAYGNIEGTYPPKGYLSQAGLMIRDPASASGPQSWVMVSFSGTAANPVSGVAVTHSSATTSSASASLPYGRLRMCRTGGEVRLYAAEDNQAGWTLKSTFPQSFGPAFQFALPDTVQVGLLSSGAAGALIFAHFDYIRFAPVVGGDCLAPISAK